MVVVGGGHCCCVWCVDRVWGWSAAGRDALADWARLAYVLWALMLTRVNGLRAGCGGLAGGGTNCIVWATTVSVLLA